MVSGQLLVSCWCCLFCWFVAPILAVEAAKPLDDRATDGTRMMCGPHCLWLAAHARGTGVSLREVQHLIKPTMCSMSEGASVEDMVRAARAMNLTAEVVQTNLGGMAGDSRSAILIVDNNSHYVFLKGVVGDDVVLIDSLAQRRLRRDELCRRWGGLAIMVGRPGEFTATIWRRDRITRLLVTTGLLATTAGMILFGWAALKKHVSRL